MVLRSRWRIVARYSEFANAGERRARRVFVF